MKTILKIVITMTILIFFLPAPSARAQTLTSPRAKELQAFARGEGNFFGNGVYGTMEQSTEGVKEGEYVIYRVPVTEPSGKVTTVAIKREGGKTVDDNKVRLYHKIYVIHTSPKTYKYFNEDIPFLDYHIFSKKTLSAANEAYNTRTTKAAAKGSMAAGSGQVSIKSKIIAALIYETLEDRSITLAEHYRICFFLESGDVVLLDRETPQLGYPGLRAVRELAEDGFIFDGVVNIATCQVDVNKFKILRPE